MEHITAIVLAAGKGSRMHREIPKQFLEIAGYPVLYYSLMAFQKSPVTDIVLVTNSEYIDYCNEKILQPYHLDKVKNVVSGGTERYWSVWNGLNACAGADYVLIHDAARPCLTQKMIADSVEAVKQYDACTVGVPVKDTIKVVDEKCFGVNTPPRDTLWQVQTPQSFLYEDLLGAYERMREAGDTDITDDTMIIERYLNKKTKIIMGDYSNLKVTTEEDLWTAEIFLKKIKKLVDND
jgi:2-C-methyl-D-erythritol 4-phosphate cytidylyltransferase